MTREKHSQQHRVTEWTYESNAKYDDPFTEIELNIVFTAPDGTEDRVPAYWAGDHEWRVRYAPSQIGTYEFRSICSDDANDDLHRREGTLSVAPYDGDNELCRRGPVRLHENGYFEHHDGTPFFWLGDTWWLSLTNRLRWPDEFQTLAADRAEQGFTVVQLVAGLFPDMPTHDERGTNDAGYPWDEDYARINPAFFDEIDLKIQWLVKTALVPCIFGSWGYYLRWAGVETMKRHWRYLIARYGAYPVIWTIAGETAMPYYLAENREGERADQLEGWTAIAEYVERIDPYDRPITTHPTGLFDPMADTASGRDRLTDETLLDFDMIQSDHGGHFALPRATRQMQEAVEREPEMPVVHGEGFYEGFLEGNREEIQRYVFWCSVLLGHAGFTYGANGLWQLNREDEPYGDSPHGLSWGGDPWTDAYRFPGSRHVSVGKAILEKYDWWRFEPRSDWFDAATSNGWMTSDTEDEFVIEPLVAGIPDEVRFLYLPAPTVANTGAVSGTMTSLDSKKAYRCFFYDPKTGERTEIDTVDIDENGRWGIPDPHILQDWLLVLECTGDR